MGLEDSAKKKLYLRLSRREPSRCYSKGLCNLFLRFLPAPSSKSVRVHVVSDFIARDQNRFVEITQLYIVPEILLLIISDDLWIISRHLEFERGTTFLAKSVFYGPVGDEVEIEPISGYCPSNWPSQGKSSSRTISWFPLQVEILSFLCRFRSCRLDLCLRAHNGSGL